MVFEPVCCWNLRLQYITKKPVHRNPAKSSKMNTYSASGKKVYQRAIKKTSEIYYYKKGLTGS